MANPSAVPASAAGTEILRRSHKSGLTDSPVYKIIDGSSSHMYTLLSIIFTEMGGVSELITMYIDPEAAGSNEVYLFHQQSLGAYGTFVWNDKLMLWDTDELLITTASAANVDVWCTYIENRWS